MKKIIALLFLFFLAWPVLAAENKYFSPECHNSPFTCPVSEDYIDDKYDEDMANYETLLSRAENADNSLILNELKRPIRAGERINDKIECYFGYVLENNYCKKIVVPKNGYLSQSGKTWDCLYGFRKSDDSPICEPLDKRKFFETKVYTSEGWGCIFGYRKYSGSCQKIIVPPANGYVDYAIEDGWDCNKFYFKNEDACQKIVVPANAHMLESGKGWACNAGYAVKVMASGAKVCLKTVKCPAGYRLSNNKCIKI